MRTVLVSFISSLVFLWCPLTVAAEKIPDAGIQALLTSLDKTRKQHQVAAVGLALIKGDQVLYSGGLGVLDWQSKTPVSRQTVFRVGSITKSFTGLTALLMARKYPDLLQQDVTAVLGDVLTDQYESGPVTLQNLLEHTAGLTDLSQLEFTFQGENVTFADAIKIEPDTRVLAWPAGLHASYSNAGYGLAGYMLEKTAGKTFEELVTMHVLEPLQMHNSGFYPNDQSPPLAAGYNRDGKTLIPYWHMIYRSFGGLNTTPEDMAKFLGALVAIDQTGTKEAWISAKEQMRFENPVTPLSAKAGLDYGYGLGNYHWYKNKVRFHGHGGDADGYLSHYGYDRASGYAYFVVITAFNHEPLREMRRDLENFVVARAKPLQSRRVSLSPAQLKQWTGTYTQATHRFRRGEKAAANQLEIRQKRGRLYTDFRGEQKELVPVSANLFRRSWQPDATYAFTVVDGSTYLQGDLGNFRKNDQRRR